MLIRLKKVGSIYREKTILSELDDHPFAIQLRKTFKDDEYLYLVFEHCPYGTLNELADQFENSCMPLKMVQVYIAQLAVFLDYLHTKKRIVHRDLKPENILISKWKHIKVIDFGDAKYMDDEKNEQFKFEAQDDAYERMGLKDSDCELLDAGNFDQDDENLRQVEEEQKFKGVGEEEDQIQDKERSGSFVGTAYYVSPEMLEQNYGGPEGDYWAMGCILFKCIYGRVPFDGQNENLTFHKIVSRDFQFPDEVEEQAQLNLADPVSLKHAKDLINKLLVIDFRKRLSSIEAIKSHPFFRGVDFKNLHQRPVPFDEHFPSESLF
mmetsp:Transcript_16283/g.27525  ORF Transcript_16283/g.27525 Transcript_16283/m.27525 type:complete len:322 (+) Transcript_16283:166-1131(+)